MIATHQHFVREAHQPLVNKRFLLRLQREVVQLFNYVALNLMLTYRRSNNENIFKVPRSNESKLIYDRREV